MKTVKVKKGNNKLPNGWVVSTQDKGRKKIYKEDKIFLENEEYFEIELYNPTKKNVLSLISVNGESVSDSGLLIRPGERIYLDSFPHNGKKFKFSTYKVSDDVDDNEAISDNGILEIFFYDEELSDKVDLSKVVEKHIHHHHYDYHRYYPYYPTYRDNIWYNGTYIIDANTNVNTSNSEKNNLYNTELNLKSIFTNDVIETGQIMGGEKSNTEFEEIEMLFKSEFINSVSYKLLPFSRKPITSKDLNNNMDKISSKLTESNHIEELFHRLITFQDLLTRKLISETEFSLIKKKTIESVIDLSKKIEINNIDDLPSYIFAIGDLKEMTIISDDEFNIIKNNLFMSIV